MHLRISSRGTVTDAEALLAQVAGTETITEDLTIPQHLSHDRLGGTAAIMQAIATWSLRANGGVLRTYIDPGARSREEMIHKLLSTHHGMIAVLLSRTVLAKDGTDLTRESRRAALVALSGEREQSKLRVTKESLVIAADHTSYDRPRAFYRTGPSRASEAALKMEAELRPFVGSLLHLGQLGGSRRTRLDQATDAVGGLLFELFENTHKHAKTAADGATPLTRSVRGLRVEWISGKVPQLLERTQGDPVLSGYVANERHGSSRGEYEESLPNFQRFLEFSIFDTGPGLAYPLLHSSGISQPTFTQELQAARRALNKNITSLPSSSRGVGLHRVQNLLTRLHGYMRIRSGRVELARDFISCPYLRESEDDTAWFERLDTSEKPFAAGTLVTFVVPVDLEGVQK